MRPVHLLLVLLSFCAYLFYRTTELEARVQRLEGASASSGQGAMTRPTSTPGGGSAVSADSEGSGDLSAVVREGDELAALRKDIAGLRSDVDALREAAKPDQILDVVHEEEVRLRNLHIDFHRERWLEMREDMLDELATEANFTDYQRQRVGDFMNTEVDRIAELAREPGIFEDPERLANDVMQILDQTEDEVRRVLSQQQRAIWERRRKLEREVVYPWLPK